MPISPPPRDETSPGLSVELAIARELYARPRYARRPGLRRMERLLAPMESSDWWQSLDAIKITGSNGKGTVATVTEAILRQVGLTTGLYTSPHLRHFAERIRIDGQPASEGMLEQAMEITRPLLAVDSAEGPVLAFEAMTALALRVFRARGVEALVAEAGIGGRYDPVRTLPGHWGVLASVDFEHTALLGSSLETIAEDKAGLLAEGGELIVGRLGPELLAHVRSVARGCSLNVLAVEEYAEWSSPRPADSESGEPGMALDLRVDDIDLPDLFVALAAPHQAENVALAALVARRWLARHRPDLVRAELDAGIRRALGGLCLAGRFSRIAVDPEVWVDIGHTPAAAKATAEAMAWRFGQEGVRAKPILLVTGVSHDKEVGAIVEILSRAADRVICTRASHRGGAVDRITHRLRDLGIAHEAIEPLPEAMARAKAIASREGLVVVVAGGLFLAMEAEEALAGRDPSKLLFY